MNKENYTIKELIEYLHLYVQDPINHEGCNYTGDKQYAYCCQCDLYTTIDQFITWVKQKENHN